MKEAYEYLVDNHKRRELKEDTEQAAKAKQAYQNRAKATKGNRWGDPVPKKSRFQTEPPINHKPTSSTASSNGSSLAGKKRDTSHCANPHKIRFKWDKDKFKYVNITWGPSSRWLTSQYSSIPHGPIGIRMKSPSRRRTPLNIFILLFEQF